MGKLACPAAFARALSLQRANTRAKSSRADGLEKPTPPADGELSKRIDVMLTNISNCTSIASQSKDRDIAAISSDPSTAIKRSNSQDISFTAFKPCLATLSERIDRGLDLWDREFSSMSSYASDFEGFLSGLQRGVDSGCSSFHLGSKGKAEDATSSSSTSSWTEASLRDAVGQMDEQASLFDSKHRHHGSDSCIKAAPPSDLGERDIADNQVSITNLGKASVDRKEVERGEKLAIVNSAVEEARYGSQALCDKLLRASSLISTGNAFYTSKAASSCSSLNGCMINGKEGETMSMTEAEPKGIGARLGVAELPANSVAIEKVSANPEVDFSESMYEMMIEKGDVEEDMEELLNCYLLLNPAELHHMIMEAFSYVWIDMIMSIR
ncbi:hypothetical protein GOP47_0004484 [Adiantum capillus-veneris]|uniref:Transcription repressor n=1 Tax=Adiantum capillus-veneris TaxID=13818 RepID=A0A9D4V7J6_ADICA|nr:hypothetical protein GOP47_0004484 [Adiantum capillus-veneris]